MSSSFHIGDQVTVNNLSGTIRFIGRTDFKAGTWIGIELHKTGTGKNDGSIEGKRYFVCPPKTGLFILASKLLKQQQQQQQQHRPSTPYLSLPSPPMSSHSTLIAAVPNVKEQLEKRVEELLVENKQLKSNQDKLEKKMNQLRKTSVESIEILEKMLQTQYEKVQALNKEKIELQKTSLEAVEMYELHINKWQREKHALLQSNQRYLKDIAVLESLLQIKLHKEAALIDLIRKERKKSVRTSSFCSTIIEEDDECSLCEAKGHDLIHCTTTIK